MALKKEIELDNGVILNYHRVASLNILTNKANIIEVSSYISKKQRQIEEEYQKVQEKNAKGEELTSEEQEILDKGINVLIDTKYINADYDMKMTINTAYDYLKKIQEFVNSEDI